MSVVNDLEHLATIGKMEGKNRGRRDRGMFNTDLNGLTKWKEKEKKKRKGNV